MKEESHPPIDDFRFNNLIYKPSNSFESRQFPSVQAYCGPPLPVELAKIQVSISKFGERLHSIARRRLLLVSSFVEISPTFVGPIQRQIASLLIKNHHYEDDKRVDFQYPGIARTNLLAACAVLDWIRSEI